MRVRSAAGIPRRPMRPVTPATACSTDGNVARNVAWTGGFGINLTVISVTMASVPSDPTRRCVRS